MAEPVETTDQVATDGPAPSTPTQTLDTQPTLNEEVTQVIGSLGRLWGGFRKQSQTAFESARKDLGAVVVQAQKELTKLTESAEATPGDETTATDETALPTEPSSNQGLFSMIKSSIPPALVSAPGNLQTTIQKHLPQSPPDMSQIRTTLAANVKRVQDGMNTTIMPSLSQAEKFAEPYLQKSEQVLKEYGEFLKEAIQIIPPSPEDGESPGVIWDGSDVWMFGDGGKEKESATGSKGRGPVLRRADALLRQVRTDPTVIQMDPLEDALDRYTKWKAEEVDSQEEGIDGEYYTTQRTEALEEDDAALQSIMDELVPSALDETTFWHRYFFRVYQIQQQEERRKALLASSNETEEDFSWEDEDDETEGTPQPEDDSSPKPSGGSVSSSTTLPAAPDRLKPAHAGTTDTNLSPRESEDSYDLVSNRSRNASSSALAAAPVAAASSKRKANDDEDPDSDWE